MSSSNNRNTEKVERLRFEKWTTMAIACPGDELKLEGKDAMVVSTNDFPIIRECTLVTATPIAVRSEVPDDDGRVVKGIVLSLWGFRRKNARVYVEPYRSFRADPFYIKRLSNLYDASESPAHVAAAAAVVLYKQDHLQTETEEFAMPSLWVGRKASESWPPSDTDSTRHHAYNGYMFVKAESHAFYDEGEARFSFPGYYRAGISPVRIPAFTNGAFDIDVRMGRLPRPVLYDLAPRIEPVKSPDGESIASRNRGGGVAPLV